MKRFNWIPALLFGLPVGFYTYGTLALLTDFRYPWLLIPCVLIVPWLIGRTGHLGWISGWSTAEAGVRYLFPLFMLSMFTFLYRTEGESERFPLLVIGALMVVASAGVGAIVGSLFKHFAHMAQVTAAK